MRIFDGDFLKTLSNYKLPMYHWFGRKFVPIEYYGNLLICSISIHLSVRHWLFTIWMYRRNFLYKTRRFHLENSNSQIKINKPVHSVSIIVAAKWTEQNLSKYVLLSVSAIFHVENVSPRYSVHALWLTSFLFTLLTLITTCNAFLSKEVWKSVVEIFYLPWYTRKYKI